jgi:NADH:ubiquinone oxidoreductase subunit K
MLFSDISAIDENIWLLLMSIFVLLVCLEYLLNKVNKSFLCMSFFCYETLIGIFFILIEEVHTSEGKIFRVRTLSVSLIVIFYSNLPIRNKG